MEDPEFDGDSEFGEEPEFGGDPRFNGDPGFGPDPEFDEEPYEINLEHFEDIARKYFDLGDREPSKACLYEQGCLHSLYQVTTDVGSIFLRVKTPFDADLASNKS